VRIEHVAPPKRVTDGNPFPVRATRRQDQKRTFKAIKRYVTGQGTTSEVVGLLVIAATVWLANLHFHWFQ
jgi:hypothetical protein